MEHGKQENETGNFSDDDVDVVLVLKVPERDRYQDASVLERRALWALSDILGMMPCFSVVVSEDKSQVICDPTGNLFGKGHLQGILKALEGVGVVPRALVV